MLGDSESYGSKEAPNLIASVIKPKSTTDKMPNNLDNFTKIMHQAIPTASGQYPSDDYQNFGHSHNSIPSQINQFRSYPPSENNPSYLPQNDQFFYGNCVPQCYSTVSLASRVENQTKTLDLNRSSGLLKNEYEEENVSEAFKTVPQISTKMFEKRPEIECNEVNVPETKSNSLSSTKPRISERKRKSLEKTVQLIENILIKSTNNNTSNSHLSSETDPLALSPRENKTEKDQKGFIDSDDEVLIKKVSISKKKAKPRAAKGQPKKVENVPNTQLLKDALTSTNNIKLEDIKIKIEHTSWPDIDFSNPFHRDCNGMSKHGVGDLKVISMETSMEEALATIQNGSSSIAYFECPHCSLLLIHPKRFLIHVKWHSFGLINKKREDEQREKEMRAKERRRQHVAKAEGPVYPCKDCDMAFTQRNSLKYHRKRHHCNTQTECKICFATIKKSELRSHLLTHTDKEEGFFQCPNCPKRFKYRHSLTKHADTHLEKSHSCPECNKKFGSENLVKLHMKTHERMARGTTHHCSYCGKGFYEAYNLNVHERTHRNDKPFQCDTCKSCFVTNASLKRHIRVSHNTSNAKPYQCETCQKCFATEAIRDRHALRTHTDLDQFPYPCNMCDKRYMKAKDLRNHSYKAHPTERQKIKSENTF